MKTLTRDKVCYKMSAANEPVLRVAATETFCVKCQDCYSGNLRSADDKFTKQMWNKVNPATGPVFVEGAAVGDILKVEIQKIDVADHAVMNLSEGMGALAHRIAANETVIQPIRDGELIVCEGVAVPIRPMIGVIGVAPAGGDEILTGMPGEHGGNMDCKEIAPGAAVYLPVNVNGALLAMGDIHAVMGDGEVCVCGAEVAGEVTLSVSVASLKLPTPAVENNEWLMFLASAKGLDECERMVLDKAHQFLCDNVGLGANDAARTMSLIGELRICQVVDPLKTMKFMLPKAFLTDVGWGD